MSNSTALVVIDVQNGLVSQAYQSEKLISNLKTLISQARDSNAPIIFMQHDGDGWATPNTDTWQLHASLDVSDQDHVINKTASDSFYQTPLEELLNKLNIQHLIITGMRTERCVDTTARVAVSKGYDVTLVTDAHSTTDGETLNAAQIIAFTNENLDEFGNDDHEIELKTTIEVRFA